MLTSRVEYELELHDCSRVAHRECARSSPVDVRWPIVGHLAKWPGRERLYDDILWDMSPTLDEEPDGVTDSEREKMEDERTDGDASSSVQTPGGSVSGASPGRDIPSTPAPAAAVGDDGVDVFDGYSYKGRQFVLINEEDEDEYPRRESIDMTEVEEDIDEADEGDVH